MEGIQEVDYNDNIPIEGIKGAGIYDIGVSDLQNYEASCSIGILKEEMDALLETLPAGTRIQEIEIGDIIMQYQRKNGVITSDIIRACRIRNQGRTVKQGDGSVWTVYDIYTPQIDWNVPV